MFLVDDECTRKYDNARGICRIINECKGVSEDYNRGIPITYCVYTSGKAVVCCPGNVNVPIVNVGSSFRKSAQSKLYSNNINNFYRKF